LAEYVYYVAELIEALEWGDRENNNGGDRGVGGGVGVKSPSSSGINTIEDGKNASDDSDFERRSGGRPMTTSIAADDDDDDCIDRCDKIILVGHSMGSGVAIVLCAAFPEWFSALVLLEGGLVARDADHASRHVRAACQRRLRSNRSLYAVNGCGGGGTTTTSSPLPRRARVYGSLEDAIGARLSTTERMPGDQSLSYEAARDMVVRATVPAAVDPPSAAAVDALDDEGGRSESSSSAVIFRHDPRLQWPSLQYYTREQVESIMSDVRNSNVPVCFLWATDGWPVDAWSEGVVRDVLKPGHMRRLAGSHHFHADPDTVGAVAGEIVSFLKEHRL
jgi:pimeloyl-ACP methyl ester carboxylesterase